MLGRHLDAGLEGMAERDGEGAWSDRVIFEGRAKSDKRDDVRGERVSGVASEALAQ